MEGFGPLVSVDEEAESDIRDEFGPWIPQSAELHSCAFCADGLGGDHAEYAVFTGELELLVDIAESFAERSIDSFDPAYEGEDKTVTKVDFGFPADRKWDVLSIRDGRFYEIQEWNNAARTSGSGRFVAIDYQQRKLYLMKWFE